MSALTIRNITLVENVTFPILFNLHKTKQMKRHKDFFQIADELFDFKNLTNIPFCTDREKGITECIKSLGLKLVLCTSHIKLDVKRWVAKKKSKNLISNFEGKKLIDLIEALISSEEKVDFISHIEKFNSINNNNVIRNYLNSGLIEDIEKYSAKFNIDEFNVFDGKSVTSNQSESMNYIFKSIVNWKSNTPDIMCLIFYYLQNYYLNEFSRASRQLGNYHINSYYSNK